MRVALGIPVAVFVGLLVLTVPTPAPTSVPTARPGSALLRGTVRLAGETLPEPRRIANTTDPEVCGEVQSRRDLLVSPENRGIRNAIVSVAGVPEDALPTVAPARVILDNRDCRFEPRADVATVGTMLETVNRDPVRHTVHLYGARQHPGLHAGAS